MDNISEDNKKDFEKFIINKRVEEVKFARLVNITSYFQIICSRFLPDLRLIDIGKNIYNKLVLDLTEGFIEQEKGEICYAISTIRNYQRFIRSYLITSLGELDVKKKFGKFIIKDDEFDDNASFLSKLEIDKILTEFNELPEDKEIKFVFAFMFSMGCRIGELRNMKIKDIYRDKVDDLMAKIPKTKTIRRNIEIVLYAPFIEDYIKNELIGEQKKEEEDYILPRWEATINKKLKIVAKKYLGEEYGWIRSHLLRHSSATHFAQQDMTYPEYCYKYGWSTGSRVPQRYFNKIVLGKAKKLKESLKGDEIHQYAATSIEQDNKINEMERKINILENSLHQEKSNKLASEFHTQEFKSKSGELESSMTFPNMPRTLNYFELAKTSKFFSELLDWDEEIKKKVQLEVVGKKIRIHAKAELFYKMYSSFSKEILEELSKLGIKTQNNFEIMMLHLLVRGLIVDFRASEEINEELKILN